MNAARTLYTIVFLVLSFCCGCTTHTLSKSETVCLQTATGYERHDGSWTVPIRGSVYRKSWLNKFEPDLVDWLRSHSIVKDPSEAAILESRLSLFLEDHPDDVGLSVMVGDTPKLLPVTQGGRILGPIVLTPKDLEVLGTKNTPSGKWVTLTVQNAKGDDRRFECEVQLLPRKGLSIVSDIDDTIKITDVNNTKLMLQNTFLLPFRAVPGMAEQYTVWQNGKGASFHYLSLSPVELYIPISELLKTSGYPDGSIDLPVIKWGKSKLKGFMSMMDDAGEFKIKQLQILIDSLPERDYVLIGDSSQHDPEVYAATARKYPLKVKRILIRDVTCQDRDCKRYQETFRGLPPELWQIFREPAEIKDSIPAELGTPRV